jgi:hypothetical protein
MLHVTETDFENREKLRATDVIHLFITTFLFGGSFILVYQEEQCNSQGWSWIQAMFYGNMLWLTYLMTSLVGKYRDDTIRKLFGVFPLLSVTHLAIGYFVLAIPRRYVRLVMLPILS